MRSFDNLSKSEIEGLIAEWVMNERNRKILHRRLIDGVHFDDLAEEFDLSVTQTKNIVYKNRSRILQHVR